MKELIEYCQFLLEDPDPSIQLPDHIMGKLQRLVWQSKREMQTTKHLWVMSILGILALAIVLVDTFWGHHG